ncbi:hypothetical protein SUGI_0806060 [Cryptomeria japonica]|uniref:trans-cinnamate:CoA ligase, peroxisomal-like n=1 Tax=Cryptomeria japonica TaxID=3369 RepID=UPI002414B98E|nr:trans-cinnamate:CoA ligase, peroxisomal-like [Cryptomeria japonica]GLJ39457.1 hypothetical protein SUGI_0806060 [Cryptomeria japonica]
MEDLPKCAANFTALSPLSFLYRAAQVYADRASIIYGDLRFTWSQTKDRCRRVASSLSQYAGRGDVVSVVAPNVPALYEMHFAVPMAGTILNTINTRLDPRNIALILSHSQAKLLFVDYQFLPLAEQALTILNRETKPELVLIHDDPSHTSGDMMTYEDLVRRGDPQFEGLVPQDEWDSIALNYSSGTTSAPKGVVYSHRGAYLSSLAILLLWEMRREPVYLWTLPMFHCNGWTFTWALAARGGTNVCIRNTTVTEIFSAIADHRVTHLCCAPIVLNIIVNSEPQGTPAAPLASGVHILTGGAPLASPVESKIGDMGFNVSHAYGLTETSSPALACEWKSEWDGLPESHRGSLKGVDVLSLDSVDMKDPYTMLNVPRDGKSVGEFMLRGSGLMKGYLRDSSTTAEAFSGGWFHTGDVGVIHPDGYVEIKDHSKDVIISGGENISSVEVDSVLYTHPSVTEAAVVSLPHPYWGETPCAFVNTKEKIKEEEIISFCRDKLPHYMVPKVVKFMELPITSTGEIQKFLVRELAKKVSPTPSGKASKAISKQQRKSSDDDSNNYVVARPRL